MPDTQGFPQDFYTGAYDSSDKGDDNDAANFSAHNYTALPTDALIEGCAFTVDYSTLTVDIDDGVVRITDSNVNGYNKTWGSGAFVYEISSATDVSLTDGTVNHVFVEADRSTNNTASYVVSDSDTPPSSSAIKIGEIDTTNDTKAERWNHLSDSGLLTFPDEAAIDAEDAQDRLSEGTNVFDRETGQQYVITN